MDSSLTAIEPDWSTITATSGKTFSVDRRV
jgi:hypothetical protein